jgi:hypothetical protein
MLDRVRGGLARRDEDVVRGALVKPLRAQPWTKLVSQDGELGGIGRQLERERAA